MSESLRNPLIMFKGLEDKSEWLTVRIKYGLGRGRRTLYFLPLALSAHAATDAS
jgi:hypothetical protein